jgi:hypothetical protein
MREWKQESRDGEQSNLEERLSAYYGPQLREQPLSTASWQHLRSQLGPQRPARKWRKPGMDRIRRRNDRSDPAYIRETYYRILHAAHLFYPASMLQCSFSARTRMPSVRISSFGRKKIKLTLPAAAEILISQPELDVLVATCLARYQCIRKPKQVLSSVLLIIALLLSLVSAIFFALQERLIFLIPIAIMLCILWLLHIQGRRLAFRADILVVQWLGREAVCHGLHTLADRSRTPRRGKWSEPSLAERIERVCGIKVTIEDDRLMLVR